MNAHVGFSAVSSCFVRGAPMKAWTIAGCVCSLVMGLAPGCGGSSDDELSTAGTGGKKDAGTDGKAGTGGSKDAATDAKKDAAGGTTNDASSGGASGSGGGGEAGASGGAAGTASGGTSSGGTGGESDAACCDCDGDKHDATGGNCGGDDCDDSDPEVFPGQTKYFDKPAKNGTFDYDCSGSTEQEFTSTITCLPVACPNQDGYFGVAPACGVAADWGNCTGTLCTANVKEKRTQKCH
jgi:hypothetical protein